MSPSIVYNPISFPVNCYKVVEKKFVKINVQKYLNPFIELLSRIYRNVYNDLSHVLASRFNDLSIIFEIFSRLILAPLFDPTSLSFTSEIDQLEGDVERLQTCIDKLPQVFDVNHLFMKNIEDLRLLSQDIHGRYSKLKNYQTSLESRINRYPVQDKLDTVLKSYEQLEEQINVYWLKNCNKVLNDFKELSSLFHKSGKALPEDVLNDLCQAWGNLYDICVCRIPLISFEKYEFKEIEKSHSQIHSMMESLTLRGSENLVGPLSLRNIGNSCYLDSVMQSVLCIDYFREKLSQLPKKDKKKSAEDYQKAVKIQQQIFKFIENQEGNRDNRHLSQMEFILSLIAKGPSMHSLRGAIFESEFHFELNAHGLTDQHDASNVMEVLIDHLLPECFLGVREHACATELPGLEFLNGGLKGSDESMAMLQLSLLGKKKPVKLDYLVDADLRPRRGAKGEYREFDLKEAMIIPGQEEEAKESLKKDEVIKVTDKDQYFQWRRLTKLPPVLTIQFKRFSTVGGKDGVPYSQFKDDRSVQLPEDAILDLSAYYDAPKDGPEHCLYRIKSMVRHQGYSIGGGHFVADVEIGGKYYECDDTEGPQYFREISKDDFLDRKDPYLLFLERIPDEEAEELIKQSQTD